MGEKRMLKYGLDWYSVAWISWIKGLISGIVIYHFFI